MPAPSDFTKLITPIGAARRIALADRIASVVPAYCVHITPITDTNTDWCMAVAFFLSLNELEATERNAQSSTADKMYVDGSQQGNSKI